MKCAISTILGYVQKGKNVSIETETFLSQDVSGSAEKFEKEINILKDKLQGKLNPLSGVSRLVPGLWTKRH